MEVLAPQKAAFLQYFSFYQDGAHLNFLQPWKRWLGAPSLLIQMLTRSL